MTTGVDDYAFYWNAMNGVDQPIHDGEPHAGMWAMNNPGAPRTPVAIWRQDGVLIAKAGGALQVHMVAPEAVWTRCCRNPVSEADYRRAFETGVWPNDPAAGAFGIGHNQAPEETEVETIARQIAAAVGGAPAAIKSDDDVKRAQGVRSRILELVGIADDRRIELKAPHLRAGKAVDDEWNPTIKVGETAADALRRLMKAYETEQLRKQREAQRQAEEEMRRAAEAGKPLQAPAEAPPPAAPATQIRGSYGRAAAKKIVKRVTIRDQDAVYRVLRNHEEVGALLLKLAQKSVDNGFDMPEGSVTITEEVDIR